MNGQRIADITTVTAFLAMAVKEDLMLNAHTARAAWDAHMRLLGLSGAPTSELLCRMLGSEDDA